MHTSPQAGPPAKLCAWLSVEASASQRSPGRGARHTTSQKVQTPPRAAATHGAEDSLSCPIPTAVGGGILCPHGGLTRARPGCFFCGGARVPSTHFQGQAPSSSLPVALGAAAHRRPGLSVRSCRKISLAHTCVFLCSTGVRVWVRACVSQRVPFSSVACQPPLLWTQPPFMGSFLCQFFNSSSVSAHVLLLGPNRGHQDFAHAPPACEQHAA